MLNPNVIDRIQQQIDNLEGIRDQLMSEGGGTGNLGPIFEKIDELYAELLKEHGHPS